MRFLPKFSLILISISIFAITNSCTKSRFEKFGNILRGTIPEVCNDCYLAILQEKDDPYSIMYVLDYDKDLYSLLKLDAFESSTFEAHIDWEEMAPLAKPNKGVTFKIIDGNADNLFLPSSSEIIAEIDTKMKPRNIFFWDTESNTIEKEDGKAPEIVRPNWPTGSGGEMDDNGNDDDDNGSGIPSNANGTYKTPTYSVGYGVTGYKSLSISLNSDRTSGSGTWKWFRDYSNSTIEPDGGTEETIFSVSFYVDENGQLKFNCLSKRIVRSDGNNRDASCFTGSIPVRFDNGGIYVENGDNDPKYVK